MTGVKANNLANDKIKAFQPRPVKQQTSFDWHQLTVANWQQQLMGLIEGEIKAEERLYWMLTFRDWIEFVPNVWDEKDQEQCLFLMIQVSYELSDWPMLTHCYEMLQQLPNSLINLPMASLSDDVKAQLHSQLVSLSLQQAVALWQMGQFDQALSFLQQQMHHLGLMDDEVASDHPLIEFYFQIEQDMARLPANYEILHSQDMILTPLEEQHLAGFSWVYQDSNVAKLCNLPEFADDEQWYDWLVQDQMNPSKHVFAVNHTQWGLVGCVSIEVHDGVGFFYYWLGEDFQGGGIGPVAVDVLLHWAEHSLSMTSCYAKVYTHNLPSQKAMKKMSFTEVPFKIAAPNDDQIYFYRGAEKPIKLWGKELVKIAAITDIDTEILI